MNRIYDNRKEDASQESMITDRWIVTSDSL